MFVVGALGPWRGSLSHGTRAGTFVLTLGPRLLFSDLPLRFGVGSVSSGLKAHHSGASLGRALFFI